MSEKPSQIDLGLHPKLTNPLSDETRKERVYLLGMSAVGVTIVFTGLIPTEIMALGIKFAEADRKSLLLIFALVVGYFIVAFVAYALSDYLQWRSARQDLRRNLAIPKVRKDTEDLRAKIRRWMEESHEERLASEPEVSQPARNYDSAEVEKYEYYRSELAGLDDFEEKLTQGLTEKYGSPFSLTEPIISLRFIVEFIVPLVVGACAIIALVTRVL